MKAVRVHEYGGPEVLRVEEIATPVPAEKQILVKQAAIGVNYIDTYQRSGLYPVNLPYTLGLEGAGVVEAIGADVASLQTGDRVAYVGTPGTYAQYVVVPADRAVKVPDDLDLEQAAAAMLQGMTAHYLVFQTYPLKPDDTCLIHAAAGGVGLLLVQLAKKCGAYVFATVSTEEKARLAREAGADEVILYTQTDFEKVVKEKTNGRGVQVVYDSVGRDTFDKSLNCLAPLGYLVLFGQSSGKVDKFDPALLAAKGSLFLTRPSLFDYIADRASLEKRAYDVLGWVASGELKLHIGSRFPLDEAAEAHRALEGRKTTGKVLLIP